MRAPCFPVSPWQETPRSPCHPGLWFTRTPPAAAALLSARPPAQASQRGRLRRSWRVKLRMQRNALRLPAKKEGATVGALPALQKHISFTSSHVVESLDQCSREVQQRQSQNLQIRAPVLNRGVPHPHSHRPETDVHLPRT